MKITKEISKKINNIAAGFFLTSGNYESLKKAAEKENNKTEDEGEEVILLELYEYWSYNDVLTIVDDQAKTITELIKSIK